MICPTCRHAMIVIEYKQIELDFCPNCNGVWFDSGELELMLERVNLKPDTAAGKSLIGLTPAKTEEKKRKCPVCKRNMRKELIGSEPKILIDACPVNEGLWFDGGEVDQLISELFKTNKNADSQVVSFLKDVFQAPR